MATGDTVDALVHQINLAGLPAPDREYRFAPQVDGKPVRRWRFDCAWPDRLVALEIDGGLPGLADRAGHAVAGALGARGPVPPRGARTGGGAVVSWTVLTDEATGGGRSRWTADIKRPSSTGP